MLKLALEQFILAGLHDYGHTSRYGNYLWNAKLSSTLPHDSVSMRERMKEMYMIKNLQFSYNKNTGLRLGFVFCTNEYPDTYET